MGTNEEKVSFFVAFGGSNDPSECLRRWTVGDHGARNTETGNGSAGDRQHAHRHNRVGIKNVKSGNPVYPTNPEKGQEERF